MSIGIFEFTQKKKGSDLVRFSGFSGFLGRIDFNGEVLGKMEKWFWLVEWRVVGMVARRGAVGGPAGGGGICWGFTGEVAGLYWGGSWESTGGLLDV